MKKSIFLAFLLVFLFAGPVLALEPNDTYYSPYQKVTYSQIGLPLAWNYSTGSKDVVIALIDTGADIEHPDLVDNIWVNTTEIPENGLDDDKNGFIDDINGWNFVNQNNDVRSSVFGLKEEKEDISHGTVIAGILGAVGNNAEYVSGIDWQVKIMVLRAISNDGTGSYSDIADALHYAADMGADIISMSVVGTEFSQGLKDAFRYAYDHGAVIVAAAGNDRKDGDGNLTKIQKYPVCLDYGDNENWLLGVTSVDNFDTLSSFANYGLCVDVSAPGEYIFSTDHYAPQYGFYDAVTGPWQGTSFATPYVAGTAALIKAVRPDWGARAIIQTILNTSKDIDELNPQFVGQMGYGRLDAASALQKAYQDRISEQGIKNLYFIDNTKLYEYFPEQLKKVYLFDFSERIVAMDYADLYNNGSYVIALLTEKNGVYRISTVTKDGNIYRSFKLPSDTTYSNLQADWLSDELVVGGMNKNGYYYFYRYNIFGQKKSEIKLKGAVNKFTIRNNNTVIAAVLKSGVLTLNEFDWSGNKKNSWILSDVQGISNLEAGAVWSGGLEQLIIIVKRTAGVEQYIVDLESGSYLKEKLTANEFGKNLLVKDENADGLLDIFRFNENGGDFGVFDSRGKLIKTISLPKIEGVFGA